MKPTAWSESIHPNVRALLDRGVVVHNPESVFVDDDLDPGRISAGAVVHAGCRLGGRRTSIGPDCVIGEEAPATVRDCCLGAGVALLGGVFLGSTFLDGAQVGSAAHVRPGTLLEEGASAAHCVGLKQTILFPFVTIGSLANFCDCLMSGGTGPKDHGEVGSSYIHFNFTPHQDKATASLLGDVCGGVMLDRPPVFLGGQGGLVGPARLAFGTVVAAGVVCRQDILDEGLLYTGRSGGGGRPRKFRPGAYVGVRRLFRNNLVYMGNIRALQAWYSGPRRHLMTGDPFREACCESASLGLELVFSESVRRLGEVVARLRDTPQGVSETPDPDLQAVTDALAAFARLEEELPRLREESGRGAPSAGADRRAEFMARWSEIDPSRPYLEAIRSLDVVTKEAGRAWLQAVVDEIAGLLPEGPAVPEDEGR